MLAAHAGHAVAHRDLAPFHPRTNVVGARLAFLQLDDRRE
jgi:hypothetical protein